MKKFYENPVVEITVFDVEDVITTSLTGLNGGSTLSEAAADELVQATEDGAKIDNTTVIAARKYSAYNW